MVQLIHRLNDDVVHKIAAGEIIVSPTNALKELIENSLDAGASAIDVVVKEGGFKLLQITDNGGGINNEDLPMLCQRFATSKITTFSDLATVATLGFRGEALASISHIAHLSVKTKTPDARTATKATYSDGILRHEKSVAGVTGTQVSVEDLFYNVPLRSQALRGRASDEYQRILDVVSRYAIQYKGTFSCKRHGDTQPVVVAGTSRKDKIRRVFGVQVAEHLRSVNVVPNPAMGLEKVEGFVTSLNYVSKKAIPPVFFINNRLVSCEPLARGIRKLYGQVLPKGGHSWVFLSLQVAPQNLDVNVHPTKREVQFLYEPEIVSEICQSIELVLTSEESSRNYSVQSYIAATTLPEPISSAEDTPTSSSHSLVSGRQKGNVVTAPARYEYKLVRTDPKQSTLTSLTRNSRSQTAIVRSPPRSSTSTHSMEAILSDETILETTSELNSEHGVNKDPAPNFEPRLERIQNPEREECGENISEEEPVQKIAEYREVTLVSVQELRTKARAEADPRLTQLFLDHTLVGIVDQVKGLATVQYDVRLYLVDYFRLAAALFYQQGLTEFANFGTVHLGNGLALNDLLTLADPSLSPEGLEPIIDMAAMLEDYFNIVLKSNQNGVWILTQLPLMLDGYTPPLARLPQFVVDLVAADWMDEKNCLDGVLRALAALHVPDPGSTSRGELELLFQCAKSWLVAPRDLIPAVVEIASLPGLYKVFERC